MNKKIIVTGGLGFIGSNLIELLLKNNFSVINLDKISYSSISYNTKDFKSLKSQDVYNTAFILARSNRKIKMIDNAFYKLNIQKESVTKENGFSHKINIAYKKYQLIFVKNNF